MQMTDEQQLDLVENHLDDIFTLCGSYAESELKKILLTFVLSTQSTKNGWTLMLVFLMQMKTLLSHGV